MYRYIIGFFLASGLVWAANYNFKDLRVIPRATGSRPTGTAGQLFADSTTDRLQYRSSGSSWYNLIGPATTDAFTNKTLDADATGNSILVGGLSIQTQLTAKIPKSLLTAKGSLVGASASATPVEVLVGTDGFFLKADSGQTSGVVWASAGSKTVQVKTFANSPFTASASDDVILYNTGSGASVINLPAGSTGKTFRITKTSNDFNTLSLDANGGDLFKEYGTQSGGSILHTVNESVEVTWNGSLWEITDRRIPAQTVTFTPTGSLSTNVTYTGWYQRVGDRLKVWVDILFSGANTQGTVQLNLPSGVPAIDTTKLSAVTNNFNLGMCNTLDSGTGNSLGVVEYLNSTTVGVEVTATNAGFASPQDVNTSTNNPQTFAANDRITCWFEVPIVGWR